MTTIAILAISMATLSAVFWCIEVTPFFKKVKSLRPPERSKNPLKTVAESSRYIAEFTSTILLLWRFALDLAATLWLVGSFNLGGLTGALMGLTISNVISIFLILQGRKKEEN